MGDDAIDFAMDPDISGPEAPTWLGAVFSKTLLMFHRAIMAAVAAAAFLLVQPRT